MFQGLLAHIVDQRISAEKAHDNQVNLPTLVLLNNQVNILIFIWLFALFSIFLLVASTIKLTCDVICKNVKLYVMQHVNFSTINISTNTEDPANTPRAPKIWSMTPFTSYFLWGLCYGVLRPGVISRGLGGWRALAKITVRFGGTQSPLPQHS